MFFNLCRSDIYEKGLLAYAAGKYIALYDPKVYLKCLFLDLQDIKNNKWF